MSLRVCLRLLNNRYLYKYVSGQIDIMSSICTLHGYYPRQQFFLMLAISRDIDRCAIMLLAVLMEKIQRAT